MMLSMEASDATTGDVSALVVAGASVLATIASCDTINVPAPDSLVSSEA
jgi:hypothetical protein